MDKKFIDAARDYIRRSKAAHLYRPLDAVLVQLGEVIDGIAAEKAKEPQPLAPGPSAIQVQSNNVSETAGSQNVASSQS